jgi:hypothetical protein
MRTWDPVADIANSDKAVVFVDAAYKIGFSEDPIQMLYFSTIDGRHSVIDGKTVTQDKFSASWTIEALVIEPGRYAFLAFNDPLSNKVRAYIGGWSQTQQPLVAGFTVKAGEVVYLGHLLFTQARVGDTYTINLAVQDHSFEDGERMRKALARNYPGAADHLQTRPMIVYRETIPIMYENH